MAVERAATVHSLRPTRVLVVSSDRAWLRAARALLDLRGYVTSGQPEIETAMSAASRSRCDVLVVDATADVADAARLLAAVGATGFAPGVVLVADDPRLVPDSLGALPRAAEPEALIAAIDHAYQRPRNGQVPRVL